MKTNRQLLLKNIIILILFVLYISLLLKLTIFRNEYARSWYSSLSLAESVSSANFKLFSTIRLYTRNFPVYSSEFLINIIGNVVVFMPFTFLLGELLPKYWYITIFAGFFFSCFIEVTQLLFQCGAFDVDDILLNTIGAVLGLIIYYIYHFFLTKQKAKNLNNYTSE